MDEKKLRPVDVPIIEPDIEKIKKEVGWEPVIELRQTLEETLEYWRSSDRIRNRRRRMKVVLLAGGFGTR